MEKVQGKIDGLTEQMMNEDDDEDVAEDAEDEKTFKQLQKEAGKNVRLQKRLKNLTQFLERRKEKLAVWREKHPMERITTSDAEMLMLLLRRAVEKLL